MMQTAATTSGVPASDGMPGDLVATGSPVDNAVVEGKPVASSATGKGKEAAESSNTLVREMEATFRDLSASAQRMTEDGAATLNSVLDRVARMKVFRWGYKHAKKATENFDATAQDIGKRWDPQMQELEKSIQETFPETLHGLQAVEAKAADVGLDVAKRAHAEAADPKATKAASDEPAKGFLEA